MPVEPFRPWFMKVGVLTAAVQELTRQATWVEPDTLTPPVCPDSDDDWVLPLFRAFSLDFIPEHGKGYLIVENPYYHE